MTGKHPSKLAPRKTNDECCSVTFGFCMENSPLARPSCVYAKQLISDITSPDRVNMKHWIMQPNDHM